jgi:hypothetical protein
MLSYRFDDSENPLTGEKGRFVIMFDEWSDRDKIWVGKPDDKRDHALGLQRCSVWNQTPCGCGAASVGIKAFDKGHSDWCAVYRSPLLDWGD